MELITTDTKELLYSTFRDMPEHTLQKELQSILSARRAYTDNELFDSSVFSYLDDVYDIIRDVLVYKHLPD